VEWNKLAVDNFGTVTLFRDVYKTVAAVALERAVQKDKTNLGSRPDAPLQSSGCINSPVTYHRKSDRMIDMI